VAFCYFLPYADNYADTVVLGEPPASSPLVISAAVALSAPAPFFAPFDKLRERKNGASASIALAGARSHHGATWCAPRFARQNPLILKILTHLQKKSNALQITPYKLAPKQ
jgi:hypothetical protein